MSFLTEAERDRYRNFPDLVSEEDLYGYFTLSQSDFTEIAKLRGEQNRLGYALQLCVMRYMAFVPENLQKTPRYVLVYVAEQVDAPIDALKMYGERAHTRTDHLQRIQGYLGLSVAGFLELKFLSNWLCERALEHHRPTLLLQLACDKIQQEKMVRPGITTLEKLVIAARQQAQKQTYEILGDILVGDACEAMDQILVEDPTGQIPITWLRTSSTSNSPPNILNAIEKMNFLDDMGVPEWDVSMINPNRLKYLAQIGRKSSNQALQRMSPERRYPVLVAFLSQTLIDVTDEINEMYEATISGSYRKAKRKLVEFRQSVAKSANEKVILLRDLSRLIIDPMIADSDLRPAIETLLSIEDFEAVISDCDRIVRPTDDNYFDLFAKSYSHLRRFVPAFFDCFEFRSNGQVDTLLEAVSVLRSLNQDQKRRVPEAAPTDFVTAKWQPYVFETNGINRKYYELCVIWELRDRLRSGEVWLKHSHRYANPEQYLIDRPRWPELRREVCRQVQVSEDARPKLTELTEELEQLIASMNDTLATDETVRVEDGRLIVGRIQAQEEPDSLKDLKKLLVEHMPRIDLTDLLIEVDSWVGFTDHFTHANGSEPRSSELSTHLFATIFAQACNYGLQQMSNIAELSYRQLAWCNNWYIREETLRSATNEIINFQHRLPYSSYWGGGTMSSSDGQRFPVTVKTRNATPLPRYFGYGQGLTFYTWTSDQFSQYGTKVVPTTIRDATYVLDEILNNETDLAILEHTTDTAGYTEIVFALFDLLGMRFSPRIRDMADQTLYWVNERPTDSLLASTFKKKINIDLIARHWDDLLRITGSLKLGWVTASMLISKIKSNPLQNELTKALQEYGRLIKTIFILKYQQSETYRRRVNLQLEKGEALHGLRQYIFLANEGNIRLRHLEQQSHQAMCLNLTVNAIVTWNTVYIAQTVEQLRREGHVIRDEDLCHIFPSRHGHINPYGKYTFDIERVRSQLKTRPFPGPRPVPDTYK